MRKLTLLAASALLCINANAQKFDGLAKTPAMGWNSWNTFALDINEDVVKQTADKFVELGLKEAGYTYIVIDDGWMLKQRDAKQNLVADPKKFPSGLKSLADYIHQKGLKFGIYNCAGALTCGGYPGGRGHEYQDAIYYAENDVDFLKYDWCSTAKLNPVESYTTMRDALYATDRPILFNICEWGDNQPWLWAEKVGHSWRTTGDIYCCFDCEFVHDKGKPTQWSSWGVMQIARLRKNIRQYSGPDHWNDFDMLEVGNGLTAAEDRSHFALWCMLASPLVLGNDLNKMTPEALKTVTSKEVIAVDQDSLGIQGFEYLNSDSISVWAKPLSGDQWAIAVINTSGAERVVNFDWKANVIKDNVFNKTLDATDRKSVV